MQACASFSGCTGSFDCAAIVGSLNEAGEKPHQGLRSELQACVCGHLPL